MKIPKRVKVGPVKYDIKFFPPGFNNHNYGRTDFIRQEIHLCPETDNARLNVVIWHEIIHAMIDSHHLEFLQDMDGIHNENYVQRLALALSELMTRNNLLEFKK